MDGPAYVERFLFADIPTLLMLLFLGNAFLGLLGLAHAFSGRATVDRGRLRLFVGAKVLQALGWLFVYVGRDVPPYVAFTLVQSVLIAGFYLESRMLLDMSGVSRPWLSRLEDSVFLLLLLGFQAVYFFCAETVQVMAFNDYSVFLILVIPGAAFIAGSRRSPLRMLVGFLYVLIFVFSLLRGSSFTESRGVPRFLGELMNDISLLLFTLGMHVGGAGVLLLMKEESDRRIAEMAFRDSLTTLHNRRFFMENVRPILARHARERTELSLLFMDIDLFKGVNDEYGHHFGDDVLRDFSSVIKIAARTSDLSCRYGGEEFLLCLPDTGREGAIRLAERVRTLASASRFPGKAAFRYSVSVGLVSRVPESATVDELNRLVSEADEALYRAKEGGRNRVEAF